VWKEYARGKSFERILAISQQNAEPVTELGLHKIADEALRLLLLCHLLRRRNSALAKSGRALRAVRGHADWERISARW